MKSESRLCLRLELVITVCVMQQYYSRPGPKAAHHRNIELRVMPEHLLTLRMGDIHVTQSSDENLSPSD